VARDRLRTDSRKWLLSKALPKVYGDKLAVGGDPTSPAVKVVHEVICKGWGKPPASGETATLNTASTN
jgi:hypothetical protein